MTPDGRRALAVDWQSGTEPTEDFRVDLWLINMDKSELYRLTDGGNGVDYGWRPLGWYPAGRFFLLYDSSDATLWALAENSTLRPLANGRSFDDDNRDVKFAVTGLP